MSKMVIALGGNALGNSAQEQLSLIQGTAKPIVDLIEQGHQLMIAHGNGPQVGMINLAMSTAAGTGANGADMPFPECVALSQGYIGYHLQNGIANELNKRGIGKSVSTVVTQVLVDEGDPAFLKPAKPIGKFYSKEEAEELVQKTGYSVMEDAGRGWRRVVPSPRPVDVVEKEIVMTLFEAGHVVIAAGGGGIPVVKRNGQLIGVPAVIDKDFAAAKLAQLVGADTLVVLTAVDRVAIFYGKPEQKQLSHMTVAEAQRYCEAGHFAPGSMLPKVQAGMAFAKEGGRTIIASLKKAAAALKGESGTVISD